MKCEQLPRIWKPKLFKCVERQKNFVIWFVTTVSLFEFDWVASIKIVIYFLRFYFLYLSGGVSFTDMFNSVQSLFIKGDAMTQHTKVNEDNKLFNELNEKLKQCGEILTKPPTFYLREFFLTVLESHILFLSCCWQWKTSGKAQEPHDSSWSFFLFFLSRIRCHQLSRGCKASRFRFGSSAAVIANAFLTHIQFFPSSLALVRRTRKTSWSRVWEAEKIFWYKNVNEKISPTAVENLNS